jgi:hypothetical protein
MITSKRERKKMQEFQVRVSEAMQAGKIQADGHTLFSPEFYAPFFSAEELKAARLIQTHTSDGTPKGTIFGSDGSVIERLEAVYNLDFLYWVAGSVGVDKYPRSMGRGSQAQELVGFIAEALAE